MEKKEVSNKVWMGWYWNI